MKKFLYVMVFLAILWAGLAGGPDLWAAPGQQNGTVPTRTPNGMRVTVVPSTTPRPSAAEPATTEPQPAAPPPTLPPAPDATATLEPLPSAAAELTVTVAAAPAVTGAPAQEPTGTQVEEPVTGTSVLTLAVPVAPDGATAAPEAAPRAEPEASAQAAAPAEAAAASERHGPSPLLIAGMGLFVLGAIIVVGASRRV